MINFVVNKDTYINALLQIKRALYQISINSHYHYYYY